MPTVSRVKSEITADTAGLERGAERAERVLNDVAEAGARASRKASQATVQATRATETAVKGASGFSGIIQGALGVLGGNLATMAIQKVLELGSSAVTGAVHIQSLTQGLTTVMGGTEAANAELEKLRETAKLPGLGFKEAIQGSVNLQAVGFGADTARRALGGFGNALATVGKGKAELDGVTLALTQMVSKGKVQAEEINQIAERVPQMRKAMMDAFGTADTELIQKMGIGPEKFIDKILDQFEKLPKVVGGTQNAIDNFGDSAERALNGLGAIFLPAITKGLDSMAPALNDAGKALEKFGKSDFAQNFNAGLDTAKKAIVDFAVAAAPQIKKVWDVVVEFTRPIYDFVVEQFSKVISWFDQNLPLIQQTVATVLQYIQDFWDEHGKEIMAIVMATWDFIKDLVSNALDAILAVIKMVMQIINGDWEGAWDSFKTVANDVWKVIVSLVENGITVVQNLLGGLVVWLMDTGDRFLEAGANMARSLAHGLIDTLLGGEGEITKSIREWAHRQATAAMGVYVDVPSNQKGGAGSYQFAPEFGQDAAGDFGAFGTAPGGPKPGGYKGGALPALGGGSGGAKKISDAEKAQQKLNDAQKEAIENARKSLSLVGKTTQLEQTLAEIRNGAYKDFDANSKAVLIALAKEEDAKNAAVKHTEAYKTFTKELTETIADLNWQINSGATATEGQRLQVELTTKALEAMGGKLDAVTKNNIRYAAVAKDIVGYNKMLADLDNRESLTKITDEYKKAAVELAGGWRSWLAIGDFDEDNGTNQQGHILDRVTAVMQAEAAAEKLADATKDAKKADEDWRKTIDDLTLGIALLSDKTMAQTIAAAGGAEVWSKWSEEQQQTFKTTYRMSELLTDLTKTQEEWSNTAKDAMSSVSTESERAEEYISKLLDTLNGPDMTNEFDAQIMQAIEAIRTFAREADKASADNTLSTMTLDLQNSLIQLNTELMGVYDPAIASMQEWEEKNAETFKQLRKELGDAAEAEIARLRTMKQQEISLTSQLDGVRTMRQLTQSLDRQIMDMAAGDPFKVWLQSFYVFDEATQAWKLPDGMDADKLKDIFSKQDTLNYIKTITQGVTSLFDNMFQDLAQKGFKGFLNNVYGGFRDLLARMAVEYLQSQLMKLLQGTLMKAFGFAVNAATSGGGTSTPTDGTANYGGGFGSAVDAFSGSDTLSGGGGYGGGFGAATEAFGATTRAVNDFSTAVNSVANSFSTYAVDNQPYQAAVPVLDNMTTKLVPDTEAFRSFAATLPVAQDIQTTAEAVGSKSRAVSDMGLFNSALPIQQDIYTGGNDSGLGTLFSSRNTANSATTANSMTIPIQINVNTPDATSFKRSLGTVMTEAKVQTERAYRRDR